MPSPSELAKKEMWTCISMDTDLMLLMRLDKDGLIAWAKMSDGCVSVEEWYDDGVTIAVKGTEGLRKFAGLVSSRLNGGGRPRKNVSVEGEVRMQGIPKSVTPEQINEAASQVDTSNWGNKSEPYDWGVCEKEKDETQSEDNGQTL